MNKLHAVCIGLLLVIASASHAQTMYRCGNTFSQQPCGPGAKEMHTSGVRQPIKKLPDLPAGAGVEAKAKEMCKAVLIQSLKDPESAKVGEIYRGALDHVEDDRTGSVLVIRRYIVWINAKNSYGGYTGMKRFGCAFNYDESVLTWSGAAE